MAASLSRLSSKEQETLTAYREALLAKVPGRLQQLILYGSRARGDAAPDSDLDIAVILTGHDQPTADGRRPAPFSDPVWQAIVNAACDVSLSHDLYVSPVVLTEDRLEVGSSTRWRKSARGCHCEARRVGRSNLILEA